MAHVMQNVQTYDQLYQENNTLRAMYEEIVLEYTAGYAEWETKEKKQLSKYNDLRNKYNDVRAKLAQQNDDRKNNDQQNNIHKLQDKYNILNATYETIRKQNDKLKNTNLELQSNMITLTQKHNHKHKQLTASKQKLLGQIETFKSDIINLQHKNKELLQNIKTITEQNDQEIIIIEQEHRIKINALQNKINTNQTWNNQQLLKDEKDKLLRETKRLNSVIYAKDKFHNQLRSDNDLYRRQLEECTIELAIFKSQNQDELITQLNQQLDRLQSEIKQYKQSDVQSQYIDLLEVHAECEESVQILSTEKNTLEKEMDIMKQERFMITEENKKLIDEFNKVKLQIQEYSNSDNESLSVFNPCDDCLYEEKNEYQSMWSDDEWCMKLEDDLENYRSDQKRRKKLKELRLFHDKKSQVVRNWNALFNNAYKTLWEDLMDKLEDKYDDENELEYVAYAILFDIVAECYDVLDAEYIKISNNEYMSPNVIDMVFMNVGNFYDLMKRNKLKKRVENIYKYIGNKIDKIYKCVQRKHTNDIDIDFNPELCQFIVQCSELIWSVLHYKCSVYPLNSGIYDNKIHKIDGARGGNIKCCIFPAIMKANEYVTEMWVICEDVE